jgi:secreted PhoX family phosphatase
MGGVTRLVVDDKNFDRISSNLVLVGTARNCGGGPSPWGWITCEETVEKTNRYKHGYAYLCPTDAVEVQSPKKIPGYGRFNHEAVAVNPSNYHAYLTEDRSDSCVYRFVPNHMSQPFIGQLQALKVVNVDQYDTSTMAVGAGVPIEWVDIDAPDPKGDTVRKEGHSKGAAIFDRGEGTWFFDGEVYICSTSGGEIGAGQIFRLIDGDFPTLELVVQSNNIDDLNRPDNITVAPWGDLFVAEDNGGENCIRWVTAGGEIFTFARNVGSTSEFAGLCFSPAGDALFLNLQSDHCTLVVMGPFAPTMQDEGSAWRAPAGEGEVSESEREDAGVQCSVTDEPSGGGALVTGLATIAIACRSRDEG